MRKVPIMHDCVATGMVAGNLHKTGDAEMIIEVSFMNRNTHKLRKLRQQYPDRNMRNIEALLQKIEPFEFVLEVLVDAELLL